MRPYRYPTVRRNPKLHLLIPALSTLFASSAIAGNTWDGGGTAVLDLYNWSDNANWDSNTAPSYGTLLTFAGTGGLTSNNNSATNSVVGITFNSGAGAFTLSGSSVTLGGNITNSSTSLQTINLPLVLDANRTISTTSGNIALGGAISGNFSLIKNQGNTLIMNTAGSSFSLMQINTGTVRLGVNEALPTTGLTFSTGTAATLDLNGKTQTLGGAITIGGSAGTTSITDTGTGGLLKLGGNIVQNATSSPTINISAALDLNGTTRTITTSNTAGVITISGAISNSTGTAGLTKAGSATSQLILSGANTFNGTTTVSAGLLTLSNSLALQNSTFDTTASIASSNASTGLKTTVTTLTLGGLSGNKNLASLFDSSNGYTGVTALTLNPASGITPVYSGVIANGASSMTLTKSGAGSQTLSGANTFNGGTTLSNGLLMIGVDSVGTAGNPTSSAVGTGALALNGGQLSSDGTTARTILNNFTIGGNVTLGNATNNGQLTLSGTANLGGATREITTASNAIFSGIVSNGGIIKSGSGFLQIGQNGNTYAGGTTLNSGVLRINSSSSGTVGNITNGVLGTGALTLNGGTLSAANTTPRTLLNPVSFGGNVTLGDSTNNGTLTFSSGINLGGTTREITVASNVDFGGTISNGGLTKAGSATLNLTGDNTFVGGVTVNTGTLITGTTGTFGSGDVTVASGAFLTAGNVGSFFNGGRLTFAKTSPAGSILLNFTGVDTIGSVYESIGGSFLAPGTYNATQLNGLFTGGNAVFAGEGSLLISAIPEPSTFAALAGLGAFAITATRRRRVCS